MSIEKIITDTEALDVIAAILRKPEWSGADDLEAIAEQVERSGRSVESMADTIDQLLQDLRTAVAIFEGYECDDGGEYRDGSGRRCDASDLIGAAETVVAVVQELDRRMTETEDIPVAWN